MTSNGKTREVAVRRSLFPDLKERREEFREMLRDLWDVRLPWPALRLGRLEVAEPAVDMFERDGNVVVKAELPGIEPDKIEVTVSDGELRITGERKEEKEVNEENYYRSERSVGRIFRSLTLPEGCDANQVSAKAKDGVIEIVIAKKAASVGKKVEVKVG
jgi:HSP20 family protein